MVSVVIPTFERPELVRRAVRSVFAQTYRHWEIIISDDERGYGETWKWAIAQSGRNDRIRVVKNEFESGQVGNTNNALVRARGKWIKILHDDDVLKPTCLAELVKVAELGSEVACVTSSAQYVIDGRNVSSGEWSLWPLLEVIPQREVLRAMYLTEDTGGALPSQKMIRRDIVESGVLMEQPEDLSWMVDSWFNARIAEHGALMIYRRPLVEWHQGEHLTETSSTEDSDRIKEIGHFREMLWPLIPDRSGIPGPDIMREAVLLQQGLLSLSNRNLTGCWNLVRRATSGRAYLELISWIAHRLSLGRISRAEREVLAHNWDHLIEIMKSSSTPSHPSGGDGVPETGIDSTQVVSEPEQASGEGERVEVDSGVDVALRPTQGIDRIAMLHSRLSGYMAACLHTLKRRTDTDMLVMRYPPSDNAPFEDRHFTWIDHLYDGNAHSTGEIRRILQRFEPDIVLMAGWFDRSYMKVARHLRSAGVPVLAGCDTQWNASIRQQIGRLTAPWYLHSAIDALWVPGERQRTLARKLGYTGDRCWEGYYSCDWPLFDAVYEPDRRSPDSFVYVGRYLGRKGVRTLLAAYERYRLKTGDPWPLYCAGAGELQSAVRGTEGVVDVGFVQPSEMPEFMAGKGVFILPSNVEPWGVVVHEAASAGLPIISSTASGASVHLVRDLHNGFLFEPGDVDHLATCMLRMSEASTEKRTEMGGRSHELSKQFTPANWADTFIQASQVLIGE